MIGGPLIQIGLPVALFIIMLGMGLTLAPRDFRNIVVYPRATVVGSLAQIVLLPLLAFVLAFVLALPGPIAVGLVVIAACPGGTTSNLIAFLGRANVALSIVLTVLASLITIVTLPMFVNAAMRVFMDTTEQISLPVVKTIAMLVVIILLPVSIGMVLRRATPAFAQRAERFVGLFGLFVLALLIGAIVYQTRDQIVLLAQTAGLAAVLLNIAGIALGFGCARLAGLQARDGLAIAVELGIKNATLGLLVTLSLLESSEMSLPSAVYGLLMFGFGALLLIYGRWRLPPA